MINKVILVGNVGLDPEVRTLETGTKVARLRLATSENVLDRKTNEWKEYTEWHTVTLWGALAERVDKYVQKGSQLYIEGSLRTREWTDKNNQKQYSTEIVAAVLKLLGRRADNQQQGASTPAPAAQSQAAAPAPAAPAEDPDDLPF